MTPEQIRVKIAEAYGWTDITRINRHEYGGLVGVDPKDGIGKIVPSYPRCLNAMIEAFGKLGRHWEISQVHDGYYCRIEFGPRNKDVTVGGLELLPVMGEAFLRALGLYEEGGNQ